MRETNIKDEWIIVFFSLCALLHQDGVLITKVWLKFKMFQDKKWVQFAHGPIAVLYV